MWLGSTVLSRPDAVCEHSFYNSCTAKDPDGRTYTTKGLIVEDCRLDPRFEKRTYVVQEPGMRFYCGVPITTRTGYMIGAYAVSDDKPRKGLTVDELLFMHEISQAVMEHLEWARDRVDRFKGEKIVRGMATFIESCSSVRAPPVQELKQHAQQEGQPTSPRLRPRHDKPLKKDRMSKTFDLAAEILRSSTLADGAVLFGGSSVSGASGPQTRAGRDSGSCDSPPVGSEVVSSSESVGHGSQSDSDGSPFSRPCKILALSLADDKAGADIEQKSALRVGTLEKYYNLFPRGRTFHFTDQGSGYSSGDESGPSDREAGPRKRRNMDHRELLKKIPGAKSVTFLPLYDYAENRLVAGCFVWTSVTGRMMTLDDDLAYLHAFGNSVTGEVARINAQKNEAAKTTFIASMSHELRTPLHGILGATEFLKDTATDAYQSGLVISIITCGKTLLDTLNHVLDYSKINKLGRAQMRRNAKQNKLVNLPSDSSLESMNMTADVDLGILVEEVVEAITAGHAFKKQHGPALSTTAAVTSPSAGTQAPNVASATTHLHVPENEHQGTVSVLLDISPKQSWVVRTQPGALRRIIMNLLGNALKYTSTGFVAVSLRAQENASNAKVDAFIRVVDSKKGISDDFLTNRLFVPFSQEDSFQPGTGLGLSIVKQIVDSLGGSIEVKSQQNTGTEISVRLSLMPAEQGGSVSVRDEEMQDAAARMQGQHLVLLDPADNTGGPKAAVHAASRLEETLAEVCTSWLHMSGSRSTHMDHDDASVFLYAEPPPVDSILRHVREGENRSKKTGRQIPVVIICVNAEKTIAVTHSHSKALAELGKVVEVVPQPCGPRKLAKVLSLALRRVADLAPERDVQKPGEDRGCPPPHGTAIPECAGLRELPEERLRRVEDVAPTVPLSSAVSFPTPPPIDPHTPGMTSRLGSRPSSSDGTALPADQDIPHVLLVDDNKINLQLLVMFMRKLKYSYAEAENGLEALSLFKEACLPGPNHHSLTLGAAKPFSYILMDISMPVMNGMESTKRIRDFERENGLRRTTIIALTGLASAQAQREAEAAGIDVFLPKPVKFAELRKLLSPKEPAKDKR